MVPSLADQLLLQLLMEQFDTLPIQCRRIEHMHEGVWFRKNNFWQNDSCENLDKFIIFVELRQLFSYMAFVYAWIVPLWADQLLPQLLMEQFDTLPTNVDTLNICMKEFIIFVCTDTTEIFFSKLRSAGLSYKLPSFFSLILTVRNKHCLLTFFHLCLVVTYWERADLLALVCGV